MNLDRRNYIDDEFIKMDYEDIDELLYVHMKVKQWSRSVFEYIKAVWDMFKHDAYYNGYDYVFTYTENEKFARMIDPSCDKAGNHEGVDVLYWRLTDGS